MEASIIHRPSKDLSFKTNEIPVTLVIADTAILRGPAAENKYIFKNICDQYDEELTMTVV